MKRTILSSIAALILFPAAALAQVSDDVNVDLTVTALPGIDIVPPADMSFTSDGVAVTPPAFQSNICFETGLTDIRITIAKSNALNNNFPSLVNATVADYVNYNLNGGLVGVTGAQTFNTVDSRDYDLTSATLGHGFCDPTHYRFTVNASPSTNPSGATRAISEAVEGSGLDDGTPYVFSDVLTVTLEPIL